MDRRGSQISLTRNLIEKAVSEGMGAWARAQERVATKTDTGLGGKSQEKKLLLGGKRNRISTKLKEEGKKRITGVRKAS